MVTTEFGVVIALEQKDRNLRLGQPRDLAIEEQGDRGVAPVAVENIAGENGKSDFFRQRPVDQFDKGLAAGAGQPLAQRLVAQAQAAKRAAEMEVGGVKKGEVHGGEKRFVLPSLGWAGRRKKHFGKGVRGWVPNGNWGIRMASA